MKINVDWLDTQEPGPYVVAVQEAWDKIPSHWTGLFPDKTMLFLMSPGTEPEVYHSPDFGGQDGRIVIVLPGEYEYTQVLHITVMVLAHAFIEIRCVKDLVSGIAFGMLDLLEGFDEEEKVLVYEPEFIKQLFLLTFTASTLGLLEDESSNKFACEFFQHIDDAVKVSERRA